MQERCRLISESQWREYKELVTKCHRLEQQLDVATKALKELKPRLESEDDWLIIQKAQIEIEEACCLLQEK